MANAATHTADHAHDHNHAHDHEHHDHKGPWTRIFTTTNHKDIGSMYLWFAFFMFFVGGAMALVIRAELYQPGLQIVDPELFNSLTTVHALIMIFGAVMPAFVGFANWLVPMQIGAADMAFPRLNNWSFWIMIPAAVLLFYHFLCQAVRLHRGGRCTHLWSSRRASAPT